MSVCVWWVNCECDVTDERTERNETHAHGGIPVADDCIARWAVGSMCSAYTFVVLSWAVLCTVHSFAVHICARFIVAYLTRRAAACICNGVPDYLHNVNKWCIKSMGSIGNSRIYRCCVSVSLCVYRMRWIVPIDSLHALCALLMLTLRRFLFICFSSLLLFTNENQCNHADCAKNTHTLHCWISNKRCEKIASNSCNRKANGAN